MIVTSIAFRTGAIQVDGRQWVREEHFDEAGAMVVYFDYLAPLDLGIDAVAAERADALNEVA